MIFKDNKLNGNAIGVFLGGKNLQAARIENGAICKIIDKEINNHDTEENVLNEIISTVEDVFADNIKGIGIGIPSLVDIKQGIVYKPTNIPSWHKVYLKDILEQKFNTPTFVNNDANCFALGEKYFGVAQQYDNIAGITLGTGLGVGIIINGKLYSGKNAGAGEFCSIPYKDHDYEYYCSDKYFEEKYGLKSSSLISRANKKDKIALVVFELFGIDLGNAIKTILYALDPEAIVIGGKLAEAYPFFEESMLNTVNTFIYKNSLSRLKIMKSEEKNIATYGAASLCFEKSL